MTLKERLQNAEVGLIGNRVAILSTSMLVGGYGASLSSLITGNILLGVGYFIPTVIGAMITGYTICGTTTKKIYKRTRDHIKQFDTIDPNFFSTAIHPDAEKKYTGYCQLQGMYLACRDAGKLEEFYRLKKEKTKNIIPNF